MNSLNAIKLSLVSLLGALVLSAAGAGETPNEDAIEFDPAAAEIQGIDGSWKIVVGDLWLLDFGTGGESDALRALKVIRHYGFNKQCFMGRPIQPMEYYLVDDQPPTGAMEGEDSLEFDPAKIEAQKIDGQWRVIDGKHWLLDFGDREANALQALEIIRKYGFEYVCFIGKPPKMTYFRKKGPVQPAKIASVEKEESVPSPEKPLLEKPAGGKPDDGNQKQGSLELGLTSGNKPLSQIPFIQLKRGDEIVAAMAESPALFHAREGAYQIDIQFLSGQSFRIPNLTIKHGETLKLSQDLPCSFITVKVNGGGYDAPINKFPTIEVRQAEKLITTLTDNPARFQLLKGEYTVGVREGDKLLAPATITIGPGQDQTVELKVE